MTTTRQANEALFAWADAELGSARYSSAGRFLHHRIAPMVDGPVSRADWTSRAPTLEHAWTGSGQRMSYVRREGAELLLRVVDVDTASDRVSISASRLAQLAGAQTSAVRLETAEWTDEDTLAIRVGTERFLWNVAGEVCDRDPWSGIAALVAPDGSRAITVRDGDLVLLTDDREQRLAIAPEGRTFAAMFHEEEALLDPADASGYITSYPFGVWSADGGSFVAALLDQRGAGKTPLLRWNDDGHLPDVVWLPMSQPGDEIIPTLSLVVVDATRGSVTPVLHEPSPASWYPFHEGKVWWSEDQEAIWFVRESRDFKTLTLERIDPIDGSSSVAFSEQSPTHRYPALRRYPPAIRPLPSGKLLFWSEERDGWGHLFLRDDEGERQLTEGDWVVDQILACAEDEGAVWFSARGREPNDDPYAAHLCRVEMDGGGVRPLTADDWHHELSASPDGAHFVDTMSRVDRAPIFAIRDRAGEIAVDLGRSDMSKVVAIGWEPPERFLLDSADAGAKLPAVVFLPPDVDRSTSYPLIFDIYGQPSRVDAPLGLSLDESYWKSVVLSQLGFVVVRMDWLGTPLRSKVFHDAGYGERYADAGIDDWAAAVPQLASRYPFIDRDRVGITGMSGGGYAAARAILARPGIFSVAVAVAGNHDQRLYQAASSERWIGTPEGEPVAYAEQDNASLADRLQGKLLLIHGDRDEDVPLAATIHLYMALAAAGNPPDLRILPGFSHADARAHPFTVKLRVDYFLEHLG